MLENGVDFAHFKFVHQTPIVPVFTRHDFAEPVSYVDFTITFEGDDGQSIEDVNSGVEAINGGLGIAVTKSWGMVDNRTISAITPVDERTSDVRFMVYIGRTPEQGPGAGGAEGAGVRRGGHPAVRARTSTSGPTSATPIRPRCRRREYEGFTAIRKWAMQFYPDGRGGSAADLSASSDPTRKADLHDHQARPRLPGGHRQRRLRDDQAHRRRIPTSNWSECTATRRRRSAATPARSSGIDPIGVIATGTVEEIIAAKPDVLTFHGVFPDEDLYVKVLEAGIDIVTTADWITGWHRDTNHPHPSGKPVSQLLAEACAAGRVDASTAPA